MFGNLFKRKRREDNRENIELKNENKRLRKRVRYLERESDIKDNFFKEMISDGLRHGSKLAAKHMSDRKDYLNGK